MTTLPPPSAREIRYLGLALYRLLGGDYGVDDMKRWNVTGLYKAQRDGRGTRRRLRHGPVARLLKPEEYRSQICPKCHLDKADPAHLIKCEGW